MTIIQELLRDDYSIEQAISLQIKYQKLSNQIPTQNYLKGIESINTIVGVDISYFKKDNSEYGVACAVNWDLKQKSLKSRYLVKDRIHFPYVAGLLGFRECKLLAKAISKCPETPDLLMCDGHGIIHPRKFGEATHLGLALDIPSIGIAKNPFIGFYDRNKVATLEGEKTPIYENDPSKHTFGKINELLGYLVCLNNGSKPVYISSGYKISLGIALKVSLISTIGHRQPEPIYLADKISREDITTLN
ncbi:MAG: endonuclease V [Promethearchaeota archaeon]